MPADLAHADPTGIDRFRSAYTDLLERYHAGASTDADWTAWYAERLPAILSYVTARSPFYARHLAGVDPAAVTPQGLAALPFTTKADLRREMHDVLSGPMSEAAVYYETTGTTGPSTPCPRGPLDIFTSDSHVEEAWRRLFAEHFGDRMPVVGLMGPSELYAFGDTFGEVARRLGTAHAKIWPESPRVGFAKALRLMKELGVEVLVCAPALALSLAKAAEHHGYDLARDFKVKLFLVLGEICTPAFAANVTAIWPGSSIVPVLYGSQEALAIATGCHLGRMHVSRPNYLVEILDPDTGEVRGSTGTGELCLTMLAPGIKPLIRYRTGDLVTVTDDGACPCGRPGQLVEVLGRAADRVDVGTGSFRAAEIETAVLGAVRGALGYQVVIDREADGAERLTVHLELLSGGGADPEQVRADVAAELRLRLGVDAEVVVTKELDPITATGSFVSWKAARILDNRLDTPDTDREAARAAAVRQVVTS
ncbi:phenylacetate--CoA ligase family protein [Kitasatospora sp. NPDC004531]